MFILSYISITISDTNNITLLPHPLLYTVNNIFSLWEHDRQLIYPSDKQ